MTDIIVDFMACLKKEWSGLTVVAQDQVETQSNVIGVAIQRWIQRPEGCEVTVNVTYYPDHASPMRSMAEWLQQFYALIQTTQPSDVLTQWRGQTAQILTDPQRVNCSVVLRQAKKVV